MLLSPYHDCLMSYFRSGEPPAGSFLFFGESGVGKRSFALDLARHLENNPNTLSDLLLISPDPEKGIINIDAIREIKIFLSEKPISSLRRTVIIDGAESMTLDAEDASLKIIEEPPEYTLMILISSDSEALLPTIVSRCKRIHFPRLPKIKIGEWLIEENNIPADKAKKASDISFGRPGLALDIAEDRFDPFKNFTKKQESFDFATDAECADFIKKIFIRLYSAKNKDIRRIKELSKRVAIMARSAKFWKVSRKLQLKAALTGFFPAE